MNWLRKLFGRDSDAGLHEDVMQLPPEDKECLLNGRAIDIQYHPLSDPVRLTPTDEIVAKVHDIEVARATASMYITVDTVATFRFKDALGFENGIGAIFGKHDGRSL